MTLPLNTSLLAAVLLITASQTVKADIPSVVDSFDHQSENNFGVARQLLTDQMAGGATSATASFNEGIMRVSGDISPARGQPGWASTVLVLEPQGAPQNLSQYEGVALTIRINQGSLSVSANSTDVTNFDYHASLVMAPSDGLFHTIKLPFDDMRRTWSQQTDLNTETIQSLSIVAFGLQAGPFDFELDQVSFY